MNRQHHHNGEQGNHHHFGNLFHPVLQAEGADSKAKRHYQNHRADHQPRIRGDPLKNYAYLLHRLALKVSFQGFDEIDQHPSANRGIKHHKQVIAYDSHYFIKMPFTSFRL